MKHLLSPEHRPLLEQFAGRKVLLGFDFDGTLAPIVSNPTRAVLREQTRTLLAQTAQRYPCVVISGRAQADVRARLEGIALTEVIGNHGIEPWASTPGFLQQMAECHALLTGSLAACPGVVIENKGPSLAIHYRRAPQKQQALARILEAARGLKSIRVVGGKQVVNLVPQGAPHKGTALERARVAHQCEAAVFVGDDETDEDVFTLVPSGHLLTIRVGASRRSVARYCLRNQRELDVLLDALLRLRSPSRSTSSASSGG